MESEPLACAHSENARLVTGIAKSELGERSRSRSNTSVLPIFKPDGKQTSYRLTRTQFQDYHQETVALFPGLASTYYGGLDKMEPKTFLALQIFSVIMSSSKSQTLWMLRWLNPMATLHRLGLIAYAFTKSDYKTVIFPTIVYGLLAAPRLSLACLPQLVAWVWLYLLQFCAANQKFSSEEDALNKPYRPIPAGLISVEATVILRWLLVPVCLGLSFAYNIMYPGLSLTIAFVVYNEFGFDSAWYTKNFLNAVGLVSWNIGAAKIAGGGGGGAEWIIPYVSVALISTTIHVQDFRDEAGDRKQGRTTFPVVAPEFSRQMTCTILLFWTFAIALFWPLEKVQVALYTMFGTYLAIRVLKQRTEYEDKVSLRIYMLWLCISQVLPFWSRHFDKPGLNGGLNLSRGFNATVF